MTLAIRRLVLHVDEVRMDAGRVAPVPLRLLGAAVVIANPWAGRGFVEDLMPEIQAIGPVLGRLLTDEILKLAGSGDAVEGYGKASIVGTEGELEHASALIHTLRFGNLYREAVGAQSYLSFTNVRGGPNTPLMIPLMHKHDAGMRSHYLTVHFAIPDAPAPDEIVVALGASIGGRPFHRIGDRYQDIKAIEAEQAAAEA